MGEPEKNEIAVRLGMMVRRVRGIQTMVLSGRPETEILAQVKGAEFGLAALRRMILQPLAGRMVGLAATLPEAGRSECLESVVDLLRKFGE